ncbi:MULTISPECIES: sodium:solute symporter [Brevibacterium]|uniref:Solute:Na+ symporter, SSS family n=2 Tax=Brevibacterium antiquum TaxID=234835 RepID=A0A2H1KWT8_9MICO|nr:MULTISPECIES: sodium:solute symporter [Brevibacterium]SMX69331.1 solute:Na+ symporter, SSS family [Brevibacterium antiquum]SMY04151.1 solute:Na+ symporter, SSS family [Brevibacterium antiquum CNRZ 918]HCG55487.1 sodium:solute symporter [Brevibacterium sp.]
MDSLVVIIYLAAMVGFGIWGRYKAKNQDDFLVAGRRLGGWLYTGTMSAVVLGGASTIGGVGLGYTSGLSGMWLVFSIGLGIILLSLFFAPRIQKLEIYTVSQMLELRYGKGSRFVSGAIMTAYGLMISTTSTVAYATIFHALFDLNKAWSVLIGGGIVILYSMLGGMWSITLTDFVQFFIQTIGIFLIMLPIVLSKSGGITELFASLPAEQTSPVGIGWQAILGYILIYTLGLLIGQDIWQRVFTARSPSVARWGGLTAGIYCLLYAVAGALIGLAATKIVPGIEVQDDVFVAVVDAAMSPLIGGLVLAAALAAMMSTASGSLMAAATVCRQDIVEPLLARKDILPVTEGTVESDSAAVGGTGATKTGSVPTYGSSGSTKSSLVKSLVRETGDEVRDSRIYLIGLGVVTLILAMIMPSVVEALTVAYNLLVAGLFIPILGGLIFKRGTIVGVMAGMVLGSLTTIVIMITMGIYSSEAIYLGLIASLLGYVIGSLVSKPTPPEVMAAWKERLNR